MKKINRGQTSAAELLELAKRYGVRLDGIAAISDVKAPLKGSHIVLLGNDGGVGHWVAIHNGLYFDAMGEPPHPKLANLRWNPTQMQGTYDEYCGQWCLVFLYDQQHGTNHLGRMTDLNML